MIRPISQAQLQNISNPASGSMNRLANSLSSYGDFQRQNRLEKMQQQQHTNEYVRANAPFIAEVVKVAPDGEAGLKFIQENLDPSVAETFDLDDLMPENRERIIQAMGGFGNDPRLQLQRDGLSLRRQEAELRGLDVENVKEQNELRRRELEAKVKDKEHKVEVDRSNRVAEGETAISFATDTMNTIDRAIETGGLESATGVESILPTLPGTQRANFEALIETISSQAFLNEVEKMKGLGQLTEMEGKKLTASVAAIKNPEMTDAARLRELRKMQKTFALSRKRNKAKFKVSNDRYNEIIKEVNSLDEKPKAKPVNEMSDDELLKELNK